MRTLQPTEPRPSFTAGLPVTAAAVDFAVERHAGHHQHPLEAGRLLSDAGYPDHVVASGVLHDVLEDTDTGAVELEERFGSRVAALVLAVSEDDSIEDERTRKAALRSQVARSPADAVAVFAADKVSKARELRITLSCAPAGDRAARKLDHYRASLSMLERRLEPGHVILEQLRSELETLDALQPA